MSELETDATDELIQRLTAERDYLRDVLELTRGQVSLLEQHKANGEKEIAKLRAEAEQFRQFESLVIGEGAWQRFQSEIVGVGTERDKLRARVADLEWHNARLIAASPELLEAHEPNAHPSGPDFLEFIADRLVLHGDNENADFVLALRRKASKARAAIAKARGEK